MLWRVCVVLVWCAPAVCAQTELTLAREALKHVVGAYAMPPAQGAKAVHGLCTDAFNEAVPLASLTEQFIQMGVVMGPCDIEAFDSGETPSHVRVLVRGRETEAPFILSITTEGELIAGMYMVPAAAGVPGVESWDDLDAPLSALPGRVSMCAMCVDGERAGEVIHAYEADERLAIGSTFKLYVLGALGELILDGGASWDEQLAVRDAYKSLPSGVMQRIPAGQTRSIERFCELMISISDNTAADHLIHRVGRDRIEAYVRRILPDAEYELPFLTTMEMFRLKLSGDLALAKAYGAASEEERRRMIAPGGPVAQAEPNLMLASVWSVPTYIDTIEWFATTEELCRVMAELSHLEDREGLAPMGRVLRINPGLGFLHKDWASVAYKGGSEPGVLNLTWLLERADGRVYALSLTWNNRDQAIGHTALLRLAGACVDILAGQR